MDNKENKKPESLKSIFEDLQNLPHLPLKRSQIEIDILGDQIKRRSDAYMQKEMSEQMKSLDGVFISCSRAAQTISEVPTKKPTRSM